MIYSTAAKKNTSARKIKSRSVFSLRAYLVSRLCEFFMWPCIFFSSSDVLETPFDEFAKNSEDSVSNKSIKINPTAHDGALSVS